MRHHALATIALAAAAAALLAPLGGAAGRSPADWIREAHLRAAAAGALDERLAAVATAPTAAARVKAARSAGLAVSGARVRVMIEAKRAVAATAVANAGGTIELTAPGLTQALVPAGELPALAAEAGIERVRPPALFRADAVPDEGVPATNAQAWQSAGLDGAGVKVAIVDLGFQGAASDPDLAGAIPVDLCGPGEFNAEPHGRAVADIVHAMAPGAQLYLICVDSELTLARAKDFVVANGIKIVSHSVSWYGTSRGDGSGGPLSPAATVADARAHGVLWINSAGNEAQEHWSGTFTDTNGDDLGEFAPGDPVNRVAVAPGETGCAVLRWDAWPVTSQDYDLAIVDLGTGQVLAAGADNQSQGPAEPVEETCYRNAGAATQTVGLMVVRYSATVAPRMDLWWLGGAPLQYETRSGSVGEPASSPAALAVGAVCFQTGALEPYSSDGPTIDSRLKPDFVAPDSVSSAVYGPFVQCGRSGFAGTSAAAPHLAGAAALLAEQSPGASASQLETQLLRHVANAGAPSELTGPGGLWLFAPLQGGPIATADSSVHLSNADGFAPTQIVPPNSSEPAISPDGTKVAYVGPDNHIAVANVDGTNSVTLTGSAGVRDEFPAWSPDGSQIAFSSNRDGGSDIFRMNADGSGVVRVTTGAGATQPSWSGSTIAFTGTTPVAGGGVRFDVYTVGVDGSGLLNLTDGPWAASKSDPALSPDGTKIAFVASTPMPPTLYVMNVDGTNQQAITSGGGQVAAPTWTADGRHVLFTDRAGSSPAELYAVAPVPGAPVLRLSESNVSEDNPSTTGGEVRPFATATAQIDGAAAPVAGETLHAFQPVWIGRLPMITEFQWERCAADGTGCAPVPGATDASYTTTAADVGHALTVIATANNTRTVTLTPTAPVQATPPVNLSLPTIAGTAQSGQALSVAANGDWTGSPTGFAYQWRTCDVHGGGCSDIAGATGSTYVLTDPDVGHELRVSVTASGVGGLGVSASAPSVPVIPASPPASPPPPPPPPPPLPPPPPPPPGGGGGGGGAAPPNLGVTLAVNPTHLMLFGVADVVATVTNTGASSTQTRLRISLFGGVVLIAAPQVQIGSGCIGAQQIDCFLDFLPTGASTRVTFQVRASLVGSATITAIAIGQAEADPSNNSAGVTLEVESPSPPPPPPPPPTRTPQSSKKTGTARADRLVGTNGPDVISGLAGNDRLFGRRGNDRLLGGVGNDLLDGGPGLDRLFGGPGRDTLQARDGQRDLVDCGPGKDVAVVDRRDVVRGCETVRRR